MIEIPEKTLGRSDYTRLAAALQKTPPADGRETRLAVLGSSTTEFLNAYLIVECARHGIAARIWNAPYGQIELQAMNAEAALYRTEADAVLILPELDQMAPDLAWRHLSCDGETCITLQEELIKRLGAVVAAIRSRSAMKILLGNFAPPPWLPAGVADPMLERSLISIIHSVNQRIASLCRTAPDATVFDVWGSSCTVGWGNWRDARMALLAKAPLSTSALTSLAQLASRHLRSWSTPPKKCLVLDFDNTLWGGVLGECGIKGLQLGPDYPGNAFLDFQRKILALRDRGILLAAASKNNAADVEQALAEHPACLLKREHFAAFEVHWDEKAGSLRRIARQLNLGIDALVFFDDNPAEREWIRCQLPEVTVIEAPVAALEYGQSLEDSLAFDAFVFTDEDHRRAELYRQEAARGELLGDAGSLESFLRSLHMEVEVGRFDDATLPRIVQLLTKTNQFNLTTRRHDHARLSEMLQLGAIGVWARVRDRFGDNGLIAVAIAVEETAGSWTIDTFLMSCRVIGRHVESALLATVERLVQQRGGRELTGLYLPTSKNQPAADFYARHGYRQGSTEGRWHLVLDRIRPLPDIFTYIGDIFAP
jgi:FkbH-like protein